jgi:hypothetical protein
MRNMAKWTMIITALCRNYIWRDHILLEEKRQAVAAIVQRVESVISRESSALPLKAIKKVTLDANTIHINNAVSGLAGT